jgi:hypothetical protein
MLLYLKKFFFFQRKINILNLNDFLEVFIFFLIFKFLINLIYFFLKKKGKIFK